MKPLMSCLVSRTDEGEFSSNCAASSRARGISRSGSITSFTKP